MCVCVDDRCAEMRKLTEVLTRLFNEPHLKVLSVFIDALIDVVNTQSTQLADWLPVMLPRLLTKSGSEAVVSLHSKMSRALSVIRSVVVMQSVSSHLPVAVPRSQTSMMWFL